jgi:hypothetical protein
LKGKDGLTRPVAGAIAAPVTLETAMSAGRAIGLLVVIVLVGGAAAVSCALEWALLKSIFGW